MKKVISEYKQVGIWYNGKKFYFSYGCAECDFICGSIGGVRKHIAVKHKVSV